jgi:NDP-sugar pyrophosphorylase family protein
MGHQVFPIDIIEWDVNISSTEEFFRCNYLWFKEMYNDSHKDIYMKNLIGASCKINPGARITNSIIGDYTEIQNPIAIKYSIIFPNSVITSSQDLVNTLVTPNHELHL